MIITCDLLNTGCGQNLHVAIGRGGVEALAWWANKTKWELDLRWLTNLPNPKPILQASSCSDIIMHGSVQ